jgi:hypothetical protein
MRPRSSSNFWYECKCYGDYFTRQADMVKIFCPVFDLCDYVQAVAE